MYTGEVEPDFLGCETKTILKQISFSDLKDIVNEPLSNDVMLLDKDNKRPMFRLSDNQV